MTKQEEIIRFNSSGIGAGFILDRTIDGLFIAMSDTGKYVVAHHPSFNRTDRGIHLGWFWGHYYEDLTPAFECFQKIAAREQ